MSLACEAASLLVAWQLYLPQDWADAVVGHGPAPEQAAPRPGRQPCSVGELAQGLSASAFRTLTWRQGSTEAMRGRFAALRGRHAGSVTAGRAPGPEQWLLLMEWPHNKAQPRKL